MSSGRLFQFDLWPLQDVRPWGGEGERSLHWFGLTDGWYTINAGGVELMRYSQRLIEAMPEWARRTPYFDYNVVRLWEDLLDVLPHALEPVPSDVLDRVRTAAAERDLEQRFEQIDDESFDAWERALGWWWKRELDRGHMRGQPRIQFWREGDTVSIRWRNDGGVEPETGLPWSDVADGEWSLPRSAFLEEVRSFDQRLMGQMAARIKRVVEADLFPGVEIDLEALAREHEGRRQWLAEALGKAEEMGRDWDEVRAALAEVLR